MIDADLKALVDLLAPKINPEKDSIVVKWILILTMIGGLGIYLVQGYHSNDKRITVIEGKVVELSADTKEIKATVNSIERNMPRMVGK
jgi:hypothetical protein